jgi:hypothetical protein
MILFTKPANLNGAELLDELSAVGVVVKGYPLADDNGNVWLDIKLTDKTKTEKVVATHNGTTIAPDKTAARQTILDRLGLTAEEAAILLG